MDQATTLRQAVKARKVSAAPIPPAPLASRGRMHTVAVTSGKGGVGKTSIVLNLCIALSKLGRRVILLDADMGLANVDVMLGLAPRYTLEHVLNGQKTIQEVMVEAPHGLKILPASSGISELSELTYEQQMRLFQELSRIDEDVDYLFIDTGAGISSNVLRFNASANEVLVVSNPEPTSITDAYALMKLLSIKYHLRDFRLIANSVRSEEEALALFDRLSRVCEQYLQVNLSLLGAIPFDRSVSQAVRQQRPVLEAFPTSPAARGLERIAATLDRSHLEHSRARSAAQSSPGADPGFWDRLLHWKKVK